MSHSSIFQKLKAAASIVAESHVRKLPVESVVEQRATGTRTRRSFIATAGLALGGAGVLPRTVSAASKPVRARVAVVGAGLAGLTCAHRLRNAGVDATVFEANDRLGGRCWTRRDDFAEGQIAEHGGELIDQSHRATLQLVQELGLDVDNLLRAEPQGTEPLYYFDGSAYGYREATGDLKGIWRKLHRDLSEASYPTLYNHYTERGLQLDQMSIVDWIDESIPGGMHSQLGRLLDVAYNIEYGAESSRQSALNLLYLLGYSGPGRLRLFGPSNEKYHVRGGNDQIVARLAAPLASRLVTGAALVGIERTSSGRAMLSFQTGRRVESLVFDKVIIAVPFSILRSSVDLRRAGFSALKSVAIQELEMGTNSKLNVQFRSRPWRAWGGNGETFSDLGCQASWEVSRGQSGNSGILVNYTGGLIGDSFGSGTPESRAREFMKQIDPIFPGLSGEWNGRATIDYWPAIPYSRGSYSFWKVGQYTRFAGVEGEQEGNCHFAGEHTSVDAQGYLEGAVESGERAAAEVVRDLL